MNYDEEDNEEDTGYDIDDSFIEFINQYKDPVLASEILIAFLEKNNLEPDDFQNAKKMKTIDTTELYNKLDKLAR